MQAQHLPHAHAPPIPLTPHPAGLQPPIPPISSGSGFLGFTQGVFHMPQGLSAIKGEDKGKGKEPFFLKILFKPAEQKLGTE